MRINISITYIYARIICVYVILVLHPTQTGKYAEIQQKWRSTWLVKSTKVLQLKMRFIENST